MNMVRLVIDQHEIEVPDGSTILDAARKVGLEIPTLCHLDGCTPSTSCMVCVVKIRVSGPGQDRLVPSCGALAEDGMRIDSETEDVRGARTAALELLLSDHLGDCIPPCQRTCPAHMDIPTMIRQVTAGDPRGAIVTVKQDIALPAVLGRICPEVCQHACRRGRVDESVGICLLKRYVADADLACGDSYLPPCKPDTGKKVAIVGAGPAGLSAAYYLLQAGHGCTLLDDHDRPGGMLRYGVEENKLPRDVLDAEIAAIEKLGAEFTGKTRIGHDVSIEDLTKDFDAVLVATGPLSRVSVDWLGIPAYGQRLQTDAETHETPVADVFAAGAAAYRGKRLAVRSVADGKAAALAMDRYLSGLPLARPSRPFTTRIGKPTDADLSAFMAGVTPTGRTTVAEGAGYSEQQARLEASRCLGCDCAKPNDCKLRTYSQAYGASAVRYPTEHRAFERHDQHGLVVYEPGKCIACGLCIQITEDAGEPLGLTFVGRGFDVRVGVPFDRTIAEGLTLAAERCARACPTGALALQR